MKENLFDWLALLFAVAIIYVLVRPSSPAVQVVSAIGDFLVSVVRAATDLASPTVGQHESGGIEEPA